MFAGITERSALQRPTSDAMVKQRLLKTAIAITIGFLTSNVGYILSMMAVTLGPTRMNTQFWIHLRPGTNRVQAYIPDDDYSCVLWPEPGRFAYATNSSNFPLDPQWIRSVVLSQSGVVVGESTNSRQTWEVTGTLKQPITLTVVLRTNAVVVLRPRGK